KKIDEIGNEIAEPKQEKKIQDPQVFSDHRFLPITPLPLKRPGRGKLPGKKPNKGLIFRPFLFII
ncbi:MAG TPA: hypothetical protein VLB09_08520, partial [Nitrospiria bacterium]|nr:hypothetical protein [Nitrospiria bacterium]